MKKILSLLMFIFMVGMVAAPAPSPDWDKSSLTFTSGGSNCGSVYAEVCNTGDKAMAGTSTYDVYYAENGGPKDGNVVDSGIIPALNASECTTLTYSTTTDGNYMFKAYQRPFHPGVGVLWSVEIKYKDCTVPEFGVIAGAVALIGALGIFMYRRKD